MSELAHVIALPHRSEHELTKKQLAAHWQVSTRWLELMVRDEALPSVGVFAGKRRFRLSDVEHWKRERSR